MVIKNFKAYESDNWGIDPANPQLDDNYIVSVPSGEVIYCTPDDIVVLTKLNYTYYDNSRGILSLYRFICSDYLSNKVKEYLKNKPISNLNKFTKVDDWVSKSEEDKEREEITKFLMRTGLLKDQFVINKNMSIDVTAPVDLTYMKLKRIPYRFNRCTSNFNVSNNELETLENAPYTVHGNFNCSYNRLKSLKGGPRLVSKSYNCSHNLLDELDGAPVRLKYFNCSHNFLKDLIGAPIVEITFIKNDNLFG